MYKDFLDPCRLDQGFMIFRRYNEGEESVLETSYRVPQGFIELYWEFPKVTARQWSGGRGEGVLRL